MSLMIPKRHQDALARVLSLPAKDQEDIALALQRLPPALMVGDLAKRVAAELKQPEEGIRSIVLLLANLYRVRERSKVPLEEFVDDLRHAAADTGRPDLKLSQDHWDRLRGTLATVMALETSLGITAKALDVMSEHDHVFCEARVLTDVRPVFGDVKNRPAAAVIAHTLRVTYHEGDGTKEFFVALDVADIEILKSALGRAESKHRSMVGFMEAAGVPVLEGGGH